MAHLQPKDVLPEKEARLVSDYMVDKDKFVKENPEFAIKAAELYDRYINLITKRYIKIIKLEIELEKLAKSINHPLGIYAFRGNPMTKENYEKSR